MHNDNNSSNKELPVSYPVAKPLTQTSPACIELYKRFGTDGEHLLALYNPSRQIAFCSDPQKCYFGNSPTMWAVKAAYGLKIAETWMQIQLNDLSEFSGCRDKINERQICELASKMVLEYGFLKMTEFMLFFQKFKSGEYGRFYASVDPMLIFQGLKMFCAERLMEYDRKESARVAQRRARQQREYEELRRRYAARVPDAFTPSAPLSFLQYRLCGYDAMNDEMLNIEINDIRSGRKVIPSDVKDILAMLNSLT